MFVLLFLESAVGEALIREGVNKRVEWPIEVIHVKYKQVN